MNYILNSLEEIRKVYTPDIEYLKDDFIEHLYEFKLSKEVILESMRFYQYYYYGDDYEKEDLSLKDFNFKNKSHRYFGLNYAFLLKKIDLEIFKSELEKLITKEENHFIFKINEELIKARSDVEFKKRLRKDVENLVLSSENLKSILEKANEFDKILINRFIVSYRNAYDSLRIEHEQDILPTVIFKLDHFKTINDLEKPINTNEFLNKNNQKEHVGLFGNSNHIELANLYIENEKQSKDSISANDVSGVEHLINKYLKNKTPNSIDDILSEPIAKLTECGFYEVLQKIYPNENHQKSIIAVVFRIELNQPNLHPYFIIDTATHYYNFCSKIGLIKHLVENKMKTGLQIATILNSFSNYTKSELAEMKIKTFENNHTNKDAVSSSYYPFSKKSIAKVNTIFSQLNLA